MASQLVYWAIGLAIGLLISFAIWLRMDDAIFPRKAAKRNKAPSSLPVAKARLKKISR